ncbi:MAG: MFS transporter [Sulfuritalea sp.]|nr:MFS transporter [Sulfuritalea sp.]
MPQTRFPSIFSATGALRVGGSHLPYFFLLLLLIGFGMAIARGVSNTLFLKRYGIDYLPVIFLIQGLTLSSLSLAYATVADRYPPERVMAAILGVVVGAVMVLWLTARMGAPDIVWGALYLLYVAAAETLALHATLYVGATFFGQEGKRLAPIALAGGPVGDMLGGVALIVLAPRLGAETTALLWPLLVGLALALLLFRHRHDINRLPTAPRSRHLAQTLRQLRQGREFLKRSPLLRHVSISVMYSVVAVFISAYLFKRTFAENLQDAESLAALYGLIILVSGASTFLLQMGLVPALIQRLGLRKINLVFPLTLLATLMAFFSPWALAAATAAAYNRYVLLAAVRNPVRALMLQALPDTMQGRARALALVVMTPAAMVASGLILYFWHASQTVITLIGLAAALLSLRSAWFANRAYADALISTLRERHFVAPEQFSGWTAQGSQRLIDELVGHLQGDDFEKAENAARILLTHFPQAAAAPIIAHLARAPIPLRDRLAHAVAPRLQTEQRDVLYDALFAGDVHARATALTIALRNHWPLPWERIDPQQRHGHPRLLVCHWAEALGNMNDDTAVEMLRKSLIGDDPALRHAALGTLTLAPNPRALPLLLEALAAAADGQAALPILHALAAQEQTLPCAVAPQLRTLLAQTTDATGQDALLAVIVRLPAAEQEALLLMLLDTPHPRVGAGVTAALQADIQGALCDALQNALHDGSLSSRGQERALGILATRRDHGAMRELAARYAKQAEDYALLAKQLERSSGQGARLLQIALGERVLDLRRLGFSALGHGPLQALARTLRAALGGTDLRLTARCNELIELVPDSRTRNILTMLFSSSHQPAAQSPIIDVAPAIAELRRGKDAWLSACALQWNP